MPGVEGGWIIGKSGANVKRIVAETGAAVKVLDSAAQCNERAVLVSAAREGGDDGERCAACGRRPWLWDSCESKAGRRGGRARARGGDRW